MKKKDFRKKYYRLKLHICSFILFSFLCLPALAQFDILFKPKENDEKYVSVQLQVFPPYRPFLSEYAEELSDKFLVRIILNDLSMLHEQIMIKITLEAMDIVWKSYTNVFSFEGEYVLELHGADFVPFFASINSPQNISKLGMLHFSPNTDPYRIPDGLYRIALEISGFGNKLLPTKVYTPYYPFFLDDPPKLQAPKHETVVVQDMEQGVHFEWKPQHVYSENIDPNLEITYQFRLYASDFEKDISKSIPVWTHTTANTNYTLTVDDYQLQPDTKYVWQIKVITNKPDKTYFNNDGYSKIAEFEYRQK
ncbi:MAG: hypothetical protein LBQ60_16600 [Bacteroidales bacterium]|jgi:hypothetical protein|nr:hypothetical protein [Bacteroidales bacterium]